MEKVFSLANKEKIVSYLKEKNVNVVWFKSGVWNEYKLIEVDKIYDNGYGIDLRFDNAKSSYYASTPCSSDMW